MRQTRAKAGVAIPPLDRTQTRQVTLCEDMVGNVWEWCQDRYSDDFYTFSPQANPICTKPVVHYDAHNVLRGGSWYSIAERARCAARYDRFPQMQRRHIGFRCARDA